MSAKRTPTLDETPLYALHELISAVCYDRNILPKIAETGQYLHAVLRLAVIHGISATRIAEITGFPEQKVLMWLRSSTSTPRKEEVVKHILSKLSDEIFRIWDEERRQSRKAV